MENALSSRSFSRCPKTSPFFQQNLPAWKPILTPKKSVPIFATIAVIFIPIGIIILQASQSVSEISVDYTNCPSLKNVSTICSDLALDGASCECQTSFQILSQMKGPVYLYYELSNFYQNHRRYLRSKDDYQLLGLVRQVSDLSSCTPYSNFTNSIGSYPILPCGAVANSIFNDSFSLLAENSKNIVMNASGIAWSSDINTKYGVLSPAAIENTVKPFNWPVSEIQRSPNAFKSDEELMVWMRASALPVFRKLHRRDIHVDGYSIEDGLPVGNYSILISYNFPVKALGGTKRLVLSNTSWMGGKNLTLGVIYIVTGVVHLLLAIVFTLIHLNCISRRSFFTLSSAMA